jgi:DNA polymerase III alpha subunit
MITTAQNEIVVDENDLVTMMLKDINPRIVTSNDIDAIRGYNEMCDMYGYKTTIDAEQPDPTGDKYNTTLDTNWFMPDAYKNISVELFLDDKLEQRGYTSDSGHSQRTREEYAEYESRGLVPLLKYMIYLVDTMRENNVVWGVGRGSSVASYVLYLIGVHRIDSIKHNLDIKEFFR